MTATCLGAPSSFIFRVLVVESGHDSVIPREVVLNYVDSFNAARSVRHHVLRDADHTLDRPRWRHEYGEILRQWFVARLAET